MHEGAAGSVAGRLRRGLRGRLRHGGRGFCGLCGLRRRFGRSFCGFRRGGCGLLCGSGCFGRLRDVPQRLRGQLQPLRAAGGLRVPAAALQYKDERQNGCQNDAHQRDELPALPGMKQLHGRTLTADSASAWPLPALASPCRRGPVCRPCRSECRAPRPTPAPCSPSWSTSRHPGRPQGSACSRGCREARQSITASCSRVMLSIGAKRFSPTPCTMPLCCAHETAVEYHCPGRDVGKAAAVCCGAAGSAPQDRGEHGTVQRSLGIEAVVADAIHEALLRHRADIGLRPVAGRVAVADAGVCAVGRVRHGVQGGLAARKRS